MPGRGGLNPGQAGIAKQNVDAQVPVCWILHLRDRRVPWGWLRAGHGEGMGSGGTGGGCPPHRSGMGDLAEEEHATGLFKALQVVG